MIVFLSQQALLKNILEYPKLLSKSMTVLLRVNDSFCKVYTEQPECLFSKINSINTPTQPREER